MTSFNKPFVLARETAITRPLPGSVSEQEREILHLFLGGHTSTEIAHKLTISLQLLRKFMYRINQNLLTHNRLEIIIPAIRRQRV